MEIDISNFEIAASLRHGLTEAKSGNADRMVNNGA